MKILLPVCGVIFFVPMIAVALTFLIFGLLFAIIFSIVECFIKDNQCHGRNNLNRFEKVVDMFMEIFQGYIKAMFCYKK